MDGWSRALGGGVVRRVPAGVVARHPAQATWDSPPTLPRPFLAPAATPPTCVHCAAIARRLLAVGGAVVDVAAAHARGSAGGGGV
jgi:hypothetical protein